MLYYPLAQSQLSLRYGCILDSATLAQISSQSRYQYPTMAIPRINDIAPTMDDIILDVVIAFGMFLIILFFIVSPLTIIVYHSL